ncbi:MAG TPA: cytochrome c [Pyrinomonadaceae bacterium]|jgi:mono/diheme cytochrome c family protein|nr:cytochrome c [Pyrinomonadaceae bacterium]
MEAQSFDRSPSDRSLKGWLALAFLTTVVIVFATASGRNSLGQKTDVTFTRDVAPIFYKHCAACHQPDDIAPFSVLEYKDVLPWKETIRQKVSAREMPPWHADPRYGDFANVARLSQQEIDTVVNWVALGAKEGDVKDLPELPPVVSGFEIGKPDYVLEMSQEYTVQPHSADQYVYVTFPTRFKDDKWVQAAEIIPGNKRIVHHVIAHVLPPESKSEAGQRLGGEFPQADADPSSIFYKQGSLSRVKMDAPVIDDGANAANGGSLFRRPTGDDGAAGYSMLLASYAPGKGADIYPAGTAKRIPAGSTIILQIHYSSFHGAIETPQKDQTAVAIVFAKSPPTRRAITATVPNHFFKIPAGAPNHQVTAAYTFDRDVELISYMPHMHMRGKDMKYEALYPDGRRETLLSVPRFQFNWQTVYRLKKPLAVPKGTKLIVTAHFDNSTKNVHNPDATKAVRWGDPTYDEMMIGWIEYTVAVDKP